MRDPLVAPALADAALDGEPGGPPVSRTPAHKATFAVAGDDPALFVPQFSSAVVNLAELEAGALGNGALNAAPDVDQVIRRVPLVLALHDQLYPSLAAEALRVAQGPRPTSSNRRARAAIWRSASAAVSAWCASVEFEIPTDPEGRFWLHFTKHEPRALRSGMETPRGWVRSEHRRRADCAGRYQRRRPVRHP